ncbi:sigma 54-interacting transcriptional regulator [Desulfococcaceae bacterium HSG7]|nr:sigma 54-interacting transcriptional regulator [Desulfococcaceae bacterium HSG7]
MGGAESLCLDVRVIAATHVDLERAVEKKQFRQDLLYRLDVFPLDVSALRDRRQDILLLADHFIQMEGSRQEKNETRLSPTAAALLTSHNWPGNVRELKNCICRAIVTCRQGVIQAGDLGLTDADQCTPILNLSIKAARDEAERRVITRLCP